MYWRTEYLRHQANLQQMKQMKCAVKVKVVLGKNDPVFSTESALEFLRAFGSRVELTAFLDCGHYALRTHESKSAQHILNFVTKCQAADAVVVRGKSSAFVRKRVKCRLTAQRYF